MASEILSALATPAHRLAALVFTDIIGSTELKSRLRSSYLSLLARHNELFEAGIRETPGAEVIKHTGDGYFASFPTASDAVRFALVFQSRMRLEPWDPEKIATRLGIHIGEVVFMDMAGRKDIVGLSADLAARLMSLATGGQILLTATAFNDARQYVHRCPDMLKDAPPLRWMAHGRYLFKGAEDPLEVYEVGIENFSPLAAPANSDKVKRAVAHDQEPTLGWRPAIALPVPGRPGWQLVRKLGEGGFGEVWLGEHQKLKELRVFKFCFDAERLRSLKREYALFRLLRESLGRRPDIAALYEVKLDEPPFFLESEYSDGGNFLEWAEKHGGIGAMPLAKRMEFLAEVSDAVAAAHSVGVLHKDIKPANILVHQASDGTIHPRLADFGIGMLSDRSHLKGHNVTETGFTEISDETSKSLGTRMYSPPESMRDQPHTTRGDIYALGVMMYQMAYGDLMRPLASGWERDIADEIMRQDIADAVEGDPQRRIGTAEEVSKRLRTQDQRRSKMIAEREAAKATLIRRRRRRVRAIVGSVSLCALLAATIFGAIYIHTLHVERAKTMAATTFLLDTIKQADPANSQNGTPTAEDMIVQSAKQLDAAFMDDSDIDADLRMAFAQALRNFGDPESVDQFQKAAAIEEKLHGPDDPKTLLALSGQGTSLLRLGQYADAEKLLGDVLDRQRRVLGPDDRDTLRTELAYAAAINSNQDAAKAEPVFADALSLRRKNFGEDDSDTIQSLSAYAMVERDLGRLDEAEKLAKEAYDWRSAHFGPVHFSTLPSLQTYSMILIDQGRASDALPLLKQLVDRRIEILGPDKTDTLRAYAAYADALTETGYYPPATQYYAKAIAGLRSRPGTNVSYLLSALRGNAQLLLDEGRPADALPLINESLDGFLKTRGPDYRETLRATEVDAQILGAMNDPNAQAQYQAAADGALKTFGPDSPFTRRYTEANAQFLTKLAKK